MSDDDEAPELLPDLLECEMCHATFAPEHFGAQSAIEVRSDACCPRCGGELCISDPN